MYNLTSTHCFLKGSKDPILTIPIEGPKVTAALWGPLDQYIITGHENGDLCQWDTKVRLKLIFNNTVESLHTDTSLIRPPPYYNLPTKFSYFLQKNLYNTDSLIRTTNTKSDTSLIRPPPYYNPPTKFLYFLQKNLYNTDPLIRTTNTKSRPQGANSYKVNLFITDTGDQAMVFEFLMQFSVCGYQNNKWT